MPWARLDDQFPNHPKVRAVGAVGLALQTAAICYCAQYLTDGFLSFAAADTVIHSVLAPITKDDGSVWTVAMTSGMSGDDAETLDWKKMMVSAGLWEPRNGGYRVHDYLDYNPSKKEYLQTLRNKRIAGQAGGQASAQARAQAGGQASAQRIVKQNSTPSPSPSRTLIPTPSPNEEEGRTTARTAKPPRVAPTESGVRLVLDAYQEAFIAQNHGEKPNLTGKDAVLAKQLVTRHGVEKVLAVLAAMFASLDPFIAQSGRTLGILSSQWNKLVAGPPKGLAQRLWDEAQEEQRS